MGEAHLLFAKTKTHILPRNIKAIDVCHGVLEVFSHTRAHVENGAVTGSAKDVVDERPLAALALSPQTGKALLQIVA